MQRIEKTQVERNEIGEQDFSIDAEASVSTEGLHDTLQESADSFDVTGFKCTGCNLVHMHDTTKHRLSDTFDAFDEEDATQMKSNSVCHCGVQEAARHGGDMGIDEERAASIAESAPIPPEAAREMNEKFGRP